MVKMPKKLISDLLKAGEELDNIDLSELQKAFSGLSGEELDAVTKQLQDAIENFDANKFAEELEKMSEQYDKSVSEVTKKSGNSKECLKTNGNLRTERYRCLQKAKRRNCKVRTGIKETWYYR